MSSSAESLTTATPPSKKRRVESSEATGNLLRGIVNWSGAAWKAHKAEKILKCCLDSSLSPSVKIQIMGGKVCLSGGF